jgi:diamine N-acetyltransferase
MPEIIIRQATGDDYETLSELFAHGADMHHAAEPGIIGPSSDRPISRELIERFAQGRDTTLLVAELADEQTVVGFAQLVVEDTGERPGLMRRRYVLVIDVEVLEAHRGQGIGHKLMAASEEWARARGATQMELSVWDFNDRARALYESLGYRTTYRQMLKELPAMDDG